MDALLSAFLATLLAEQGDTSQLLAAAIAARYALRPPVLAALAVAIALNAGLAAAAGAAAQGLMPYRAILLLTALALLFAGGGALFAPKPPRVVVYHRLAPPIAAFLAMTVQLFGDRTQVVTFSLASWSAAPVLAATGATLGTLAGILPALALGAGVARLPARPLRLAAGSLLLIAGVAVALVALRLV